MGLPSYSIVGAPSARVNKRLTAGSGSGKEGLGVLAQGRARSWGGLGGSGWASRAGMIDTERVAGGMVRCKTAATKVAWGRAARARWRSAGLGSRSPEGLLGGVKRLPLSGFRALRRAAGGRAERTGLTPGGASARNAPHVVRSMRARRHGGTVPPVLATISHVRPWPPRPSNGVRGLLPMIEAWHRR